MIKWIRAWRAGRRAEKIRRGCRANGHLLEVCGDLKEGNAMGVPLSGPKFGLYSCVNKCGYGEVNELGMKPYPRSWAEAERLVAIAKRGGAK